MTFICFRDVLRGVPAFIVANGPSLANVDLSPLSNRFTLGVNRAFYRLDPTILLWQDISLMREHADEVKKLSALKVCRLHSDYGYNVADMLFDWDCYGTPPEAQKSSGVLAANLAALMGCSPIVLLGFDCCYQNGRTDFYGTNSNHHAQTLPNCRNALQWLSGQGLDLINCSANEVISPRVTIGEALAAVGDKGIGTREDFLGRLRK